MALVTLNSVSINKTYASDYSDIILYYLDTDSGPSGYTLIKSTTELYNIFNTNNRSINFHTAEYLLNLGYRLLVKKISKVDNTTSLRIFEDGTVSHPRKGVSYSDSIAAEKGQSQVYSMRIDFSAGIEEGDFFMISNIGYVTVGYYNKLFIFSNNRVTNNNLDIILQMCTGGYNIIPVNDDWKNNLVETLFQSGYNSKWLSDTVLLIESYIPILFTKVSNFTGDTIKFPITKDSNSTYDYECTSKYGKELVDFYSKNNINQDSIQIKINKLHTGYYRIKISNVIDRNTYFFEEYVVSMNPNDDNFIQKVLYNSQLVEVVWYKEGDISGDYTLTRVDDTTVTSEEDIISIINDNYPFEMDAFDYVVDAGLSKNIQQAIYERHKTVDCLKLFTLYDTIPDSDFQDRVMYTYPWIYIDGLKYPAWICAFELIKDGSYSGEVTLQKIESDFEIEDDTDVHCIGFDNYRYLFPSKHIYIDGKINCIETLIFLSRIRTKILFNLTLYNDVNRIYREFVEYYNRVINLSGSRVSSINIDNMYILEKVLIIKLTLTYSDTWIDPVSLNITIDV